MLLWKLMPDCKVSEATGAYGCFLLDMNMNSFMGITIMGGFLGSFLLSPVGIVVMVIGAGIAMFRGGRDHSRQ